MRKLSDTLRSYPLSAFEDRRKGKGTRWRHARPGGEPLNKPASLYAGSHRKPSG
jgi:hypothetical protein